jgi:Tetratricopeptide repeat
VIRTLWLCFVVVGLSSHDFEGGSQARRAWPRTARVIPDVVLLSLQGKRLRLRQEKGDARMLFLVKAHQEMSLDLMGRVGKLEAEGGLRGVEGLFVSTDIIHRAWFEDHWAQLSLPHPLLFDLGHRLLRDFNVGTLPQVLTFDRRGQLLHAMGPGEGLGADRIRAWAGYASGKETRQDLDMHLSALDSKGILARRRAQEWLLQAQREADRGAYKAAVLAARRALKTYPGSIQVVLGAAKVLALAGARGQAQELASSVLTRRPGHKRAMTILGITLVEEGKIDDARRLLEAALPLNPDPRLVRVYLARIHEKKGEIDAALRLYRLALDPDRIVK